MRVVTVLLMLIALPAMAAERSIDKLIVVPATLDQAWDAWTTREGITSFFAPDARVEPKVGGAFQVLHPWDGVLANLKKRFESGLQDWTEWMNTMRKMQEQKK